MRGNKTFADYADSMRGREDARRHWDSSSAMLLDHTKGLVDPGMSGRVNASLLPEIPSASLLGMTRHG
jgi:hypothetical protein